MAHGWNLWSGIVDWNRRSWVPPTAIPPQIFLGDRYLSSQGHCTCPKQLVTLGSMKHGKDPRPTTTSGNKKPCGDYNRGSCFHKVCCYAHCYSVPGCSYAQLQAMTPAAPQTKQKIDGSLTVPLPPPWPKSLNVQPWRHELKGDEDEEFLLQGITQGFHLKLHVYHNQLMSITIDLPQCHRRPL